MSNHFTMELASSDRLSVNVHADVSERERGHGVHTDIRTMTLPADQYRKAPIVILTVEMQQLLGSYQQQEECTGPSRLDNVSVYLTVKQANETIEKLQAMIEVAAGTTEVGEGDRL